MNLARRSAVRELTTRNGVPKWARKIPEAAGPRGAKDSGYFREAIANFRPALQMEIYL